MRSPNLTLLREPLVLFFIAGILLFGLDQAVSALRGDADIRVPAPVRAAAAASLQGSLGRAPSEDELRVALQPWVHEEAVYREGLRRGLDRSDRMIRDRVVHQTLAALQLEHTLPSINDAELERWFAANTARYATPTVFDLEVMTLLDTPTDAQIGRTLERLNDADQPGSQPGPNATLHIYRDAPEGLLVRSYGARLAATARHAEPGRWVRAPADQAVLFVRVQQVKAGHLPDFQDLRSRVLNDWRREQREQALEHRLKQLVQRYRVQYSQE